jgi:single-strand DNA-binding protein
MAKDLNYCSFIGRIGKDISLRQMPNGNAVANFSIACGDDYKDKNTGQKVEQTNWINIVMFGNTAEILNKYCQKGSRIFVSGKQTSRKYQDNNGQDRWVTEIKANEFQMLDSKGSGGASSSKPAASNNTASPSAPPPSDGFDDSDIPF